MAGGQRKRLEALQLPQIESQPDGAWRRLGAVDMADCAATRCFWWDVSRMTGANGAPRSAWGLLEAAPTVGIGRGDWDDQVAGVKIFAVERLGKRSPGGTALALRLTQ